MRYFLIVIFTFFYFDMISQELSTNSFQSKILTCVKNKPKDGAKINLIDHLSSCMYSTKFPFFCVDDVNENTYCSDKFDGYYLLNYWFEGCVRCKKEKPFLERLTKELPSLKIISLSKDSPNSFDEILSKNLEWICVANYENKGLPRASTGYPLTILLNKDGIVCSFNMGGIIDEEKYNDIIQIVENK